MWVAQLLCQQMGCSHVLHFGQSDYFKGWKLTAMKTVESASTSQSLSLAILVKQVDWPAGTNASISGKLGQGNQGHHWLCMCISVESCRCNVCTAVAGPALGLGVLAPAPDQQLGCFGGRGCGGSTKGPTSTGRWAAAAALLWRAQPMCVSLWGLA